MEIVLSNLGFSMAKVMEALIYLRSISKALDVSPEEWQKYEDVLSDRSDAPVLAVAVKAKCIMLTGDKKLRREASAHVKVMTAREVPEG